MYTLDPTAWAWRNGFRGHVNACIDTRSDTIGFIGQRRGHLVIPIASITRVLIGSIPARSFRIHYAYIWHSAHRRPMAVRMSGESPQFGAFARHLVEVLADRTHSPAVELGTTPWSRIGTSFATYGIWLVIALLAAANELMDDMYSLLGRGPAGGAVFGAVALAIAILAWRHDRRMYRPRPWTSELLDRTLPR